MFHYPSLSDDVLLQLMGHDDEEAFTQLFDRHWERVARYVSRVIKSPDDAQDIVQEIFISIWRRRHALVVGGTFVAYLLKSARNLSIRHMESSLHRQDFLSALAEHTRFLDFSAIDILQLEELEAKVDKAIAALPPKMREVYLLSRHENLSYREIALRLGIAETTVKKQVNNALKTIRVEIGGYSATVLLYCSFL